MHTLDLDPMRYTADPPQVLDRKMGEKLILVAANGVSVLADRLLKGPPANFDHCVGDLQNMGIVQRASQPLAGSRRHFSLVDNGRMQEESMPGSKIPMEQMVTLKDAN